MWPRCVAHVTVDCESAIMMLRLSLLVAIIIQAVLSTTDEKTEALEMAAFELCDMDRMVGLTWREVEACEQRYAGVLEDQGIAVPTFAMFQEADEDGNGVLFYEEWYAHYNRA